MTQTLPQWVLDSLADGVLVVGGDGTVLALNPAAERLLGVTAATARGQPFAATFVEDVALDPLVAAILEAVYDARVVHNRLLRLERPDAAARTLALTTSLLRDSGGQRLGVIALLNDISEIEALRAREQALNADLSQSNRALTEAYGALETRNAELQNLTRRVQLARGLATGFVILLFLGVGLYSWRMDSGGFVETAAPAATATGAVPATLRLEPSAQRIVLLLTGYVEPVAEVNLVAPLNGAVEQRFFDYGEPVTAGQPLFTVAREAATADYRDARAQYLQALEEHEKLNNWDDGPEMRRARRGLHQAETRLRTLARKATETKRLLDLGIVPAAELEDLQEQIAAGELEVTQAREEIASTQAEGSEDRRLIARLRLENAEYAMRELERKLERTQVVAPVDGVVMAPRKTTESRFGSVGALEVGTPLYEGMIALTLGDLTGIAVRVNVDEMEVTRVRPGQAVWVTGTAFPEVRLEGRVEKVSAEARRGEQGGAPSFDLLVRVPALTPAQRELVRSGMSARLEIVIQDEAAALMVPIGAVRLGPDGPRVRVRENGAVREVPVTAGSTDVDSVRILSGLKPGMEIVVTP